MKNAYLIPTLGCLAVFTAGQAQNYYDETHSNINTWETSSTYETPKEWVIQLGGGAMVSPEYLGGDDYEVDALPYVRVEYRDRITFSVPEGLNVKAGEWYGWNGGTWEAEAGLGYDFGREADDADILTGLGDVDDAVLIQGKVTHKHDTADISLQVRQALAGHEGYDVTAEVSRKAMVPQYRTFVNYGANLVWASEDKMQAYHGLTASQVALSPHFTQTYTPDAGFQTVGLNVMSVTQLNEDWSLVGLAGMDVLVGDAADSPLTQEDLQWTAGAFLSYEF